MDAPTGALQHERSAEEGSTEPPQPSDGWDRFERALRIVAFAVVIGVVALSLFGVLGLRTREVSAEGDLTLTVTYAQVTRGGIGTPFEIEIRAESGLLPEELDVLVPVDYLAMFDENGLDPEPDATASDGVVETWTFETDGQHVLSIDFDARMAPGTQWGTDGFVAVESDDVEPVRVDFHTWVAP